MRHLSKQEIQAISGGAGTSGASPAIGLREIGLLLLTGLYLLITGKSLIDLI